ncbi:hypothetical protein M5K25_008623 [Dendrobium thyrsiflorum]|uniref:Uncharacterized protein n=1 Tax=Dendrobium thyrsiflorum TaxID=117978 RepID=A0ABD0V937_DENTH
MSMVGFMRHRIGKLQEQIRNQERENREVETRLLMYKGLMEMAAKADIKEEADIIMKEVAAAAPQAKEKMVFDEAMEDLQRHNWFRDIMNPQEDIIHNVPFYEH